MDYTWKELEAYYCCYKTKNEFLLLLKGLNKQGWIDWILSWCKWFSGPNGHFGLNKNFSGTAAVIWRKWLEQKSRWLKTCRIHLPHIAKQIYKGTERERERERERKKEREREGERERDR